MDKLRRASGGVSKTMVFGVVFLVLSLVGVALGQVGYEEFVPSSELLLIADAAAAILVMVFRHLTKEPMA